MSRRPPIPPSPRHSPPPAGDLPPHSEEEEAIAMGCVMAAGAELPQVEVDAMLARLSPGLFYLERFRLLLEDCRKVRASGHAVLAATLVAMGSSWTLAELAGLQNGVASILQFDYVLPRLQELSHRRWLVRKAGELRDLASAPTVTLEDTRGRLSEILDATDRASATTPAIEVLGVDDLNEYQPDPANYLIGENVISRQSKTVICGWPGLGKSRLTTTLAVAGASGFGHWMGYAVRRQFRTLILQSENSVGRLKSEVMDVPMGSIRDWVRWSKPCDLAFHRAEFRRRLMQIWEAWPFDVLVVDPWTDVVRDAEAGDVAEAFQHIDASLPRGERAPAVVIVAHIRKQGRTDKWRPKAGSELMHEVLGSQSTVGKARTVFALQPGDPTDNQSDVVIFDAGKCNDGRPNPASAWRRRNGAFEAIPDFDFDAWRNPPDDESRKVITEDTIRKVLAGVFLSRGEAVQAIERMGFSQAAAYRALSADGKFAHLVKVVGGGKLTLAS